MAHKSSQTADPLTQQLAAKIAQKGPQSGPPATMTKPPEKAPDIASEAKMLAASWKPTTDEGMRYKDELAALVGGGAEEAGPLPV